MNEVIAKQLTRAALDWMDTAGHLIWPSFIAIENLLQFLAATGGLGASVASLFPFSGSSTDVIQSPDMTASLRYFSKSSERNLISPHFPSRIKRE